MKDYGDEEWDEKMKGVWKCIKPNLQRTKYSGSGGGEGGPEIKVAQNVLKHILVLEFLKSDEIFKIRKKLC